MIIRELIDFSKTKLQNAGIESAHLDAMILLEAANGKDRSWLLAHSDEQISPTDLTIFREFITRRVKREPIAHIIGKKEFYGRKFLVSKDVLTPRPETEILIDAALKYIPEPSKILDLGTGSGCILLTLLLECPNAFGVGVDVSTNALAIACENAYNLGVRSFELIHSNWCENLNERHFNLIVSNPPYVAKTERSKLDAELDYEPETALFGGDDGLECYRAIAQAISPLTFDFAIFEIGKAQENAIKEIFGNYQIELIETIADLAGISRVMVFKK